MTDEQPEQWAVGLWTNAADASDTKWLATTNVEKSERIALCDNAAAILIQRAFAEREADMVGAETHRIGDMVKIIAPQWEHEPPHYITGIDWHPKHGITYTTSEVWPPKVEGFHVCGLTDEWLPEDIAALKSREAGHG